MTKGNIYIVLTRTNTVLSRLIRIIKKDEFTYAAISSDKELNSMYRYSRRHTFNPLPVRYKKEDIKKDFSVKEITGRFSAIYE